MTVFAQTFVTKADRLQWWQDARFGMFIHWGPVSQTGKEIGWSRGNQVPIDEYDNLYKTFNPTEFNAEEWVKIAKAAGMKYIVFTTKHHDGFCMWDTKQTAYNIMNTPFKRDVLKELAQACKKYGIALGTYYSTCDWHHPDFPFTSPGGKMKRDTSNIDSYTHYLKRQVAELLLNYGPLSTIWFDVPQGFDAKRGQDVINFVQTFQPDILINNRTGATGDYSTPEQRIGDMQMDRPWETCMTIGQQWSYKPDEKLKSLKTCIRGLISSASGNGNFLFNVGPSPAGIIEPKQVEILKQMGQWLNVNGESIYNSKGGPYIRSNSLASTRKGNVVYLHFFDLNKSTVFLPALSANILQASLINGKKVEYSIDKNRIRFNIPKNEIDSISTIIKLELDRSATSLPLVDPLYDILVTASNFKKPNKPEWLVDKSIKMESAWKTEDSVKTAWVQFDLRSKKTVNAISLFEGPFRNIKKFSLAYQIDDKWVEFYRGKEIGEKCMIKMKSINTQLIRLNILQSDTAPSLLEFDFQEIN